MAASLNCRQKQPVRFPFQPGHSRNSIDSGNAYDVLLPVPFRTA